MAFSHEFSLPVAKLVRRAAEMVAAVENFMVSPTMHKIVMMLLAPMLLFDFLMVEMDCRPWVLGFLPLCTFRWSRDCL